MKGAAIALSLLAGCGLAAASDNYAVVPWFSGSSPKPLNATTWTGVVRSTKRTFTGHVGVLEQSSLFSIELPHNGCANHTVPSKSASDFNCQLATNGGFFEFTPPACEYNLIVNGTAVQYPGDDTMNFGVVAKDQKFVIGYVSAATYKSFGFSSLVSGRGWLVHQGASNVNNTREFQPKPWTNGFVTEKAPRTGIGLRADGALLLLVVDGIETKDEGVDLYEFAEIFMDLGATEAINVDGGGSSDAVLDGKIWSRPTCQDTPTPICEREVTSITCIRYPAA